MAAASVRSPAGLRLRVFSAPGGTRGPKASSASSAAAETGLQAQRECRRVMAFQHAGRPRRASRLGTGQRPDDGLDLLRRQPAGPQQPRVRPAEIDDGEFKADGGRSVIEDHRHPVAETLGDMGRRGGAEAPGGIGAGGGDGPAEGLEQAGRHGMARHPDRQSIEPRRGQQRDGTTLPAWQDQGQRPGPEMRRHDPRALIHRHQGFGGGLVREMDDQRV